MNMPERLSTRMLRANLLCRHCDVLLEDAEALRLPDLDDEPRGLVCPTCRHEIVEYDVDEQKHDVDHVAVLLRRWASAGTCTTARDVLRAAATLERVSDFITER